MTDADLVLGRLNPRFFLGGRAALDRDAAAEAIEQRIAAPLEMTLEEAALAIVRIVDAHMSDLVRRVSVERGFDPRRFTIYAFGGAGPGHVGAYGAGLGAEQAVVPASASEFSAFGIAGSDLLTVVESSEPASAPFDVERLKDIFTALEHRAADELSANGVPVERMVLRRFARLRYQGQVHELRTPVPELNGSDSPLVAAFERLYEEKFGSGAAYRQAGIQALTYTVHGYGTLNQPTLAPEPLGSEEAAQALVERRTVIFADDGGVEAAVYRADLLRPGNLVPGPAVVEAPTTTTLVHPDQSAAVDGYRNLVISLGKGIS